MRHMKTMLAALAGAMTAPAGAGPLIIAPTTLEIAPQRASAMLSVTNDSDAPVDLQFRAYAWSQPDGGEALLPTGDLVISPAIVTVAPHKKQVFRILRVKATQGGPEPSYRLRLNELPRAGGAGIAINLEFSLPVFVATPGARPMLSWSSDGATVTVANQGTRRIRLSELTLTAAGGARIAVPGARSAYILAGAHKTFALGAPSRMARDATSLAGVADTGPIDLAATGRTDVARTQSAAR